MTRNNSGTRLIAATILALSLSTIFTPGSFAAISKSAPAKAGAACATAGATTTVSGKALICAKSLSGKLTWSAPAPAAAGSRAGGADAGGPNGNPAFAAAMTKYTACLKAQGVTLPAFGGGRGGFGGAPTAGAKPAPEPSRTPLTAKQQAAMTKCAALRPAFGGRRGAGGAGGFGGGAGAPGGFGGGASLPNTPANTAAYIACLNTNGVNIASLADIAGLDRQSPKIATALAACRSKRVASN